MTLVVVRRRAQADVEDAVDWYLAVAPGVAPDMVSEYDKVLERIGQFPRLCAREHRNVRLASLRRFPYNVWYVYDETADVAVVLRVSHQRQDDAQIKRELPEE